MVNGVSISIMYRYILGKSYWYIYPSRTFFNKSYTFILKIIRYLQITGKMTLFFFSFYSASFGIKIFWKKLYPNIFPKIPYLTFFIPYLKKFIPYLNFFMLYLFYLIPYLSKFMLYHLFFTQYHLNRTCSFLF